MRILEPTSTAPARDRQRSARERVRQRSASTPPNPARTTAAPAGVRTIGGIDTLLALQGVDDPAERRRKAVKRGRGALDALDALKLGLLSGTLDTAALARLEDGSAGLAEPTGEPGLDKVLAEIALRVEVELAKIGMPRGRQGTRLSRGSVRPNRAAVHVFHVGG